MVSSLKRLLVGALGILVFMSAGQLAHAGSGGDEAPSGWSQLNMTQGVTGVSQDIYELHMIVIWICVVIAVAVFGVMFYSMFAHRKSKGHQASNFHESTVVELAWTIVPALILIVIAVPATKAIVNLYDTSEADIDIKVTGYQWKWQYEYLGEGVEFMSELSTTPGAINNTDDKTEYYLAEVNEPVVLPVGKKIRFLTTAKDVIHSWWVPELGVKRDAIPGFVNDSWARIDVPGIYRGFCAELCGKGHAFMPIVVNAVSEGEYQNWLAEKKAETAALRELAEKTFTMEELMARGEEAYVRSCAACHAANGEGIPGAFPGLKASPVALGSMETHLEVVVNGVPGTAMQAFGGQLSEVDLAAIITYERNAWGNNVGDMVQPIDVLKFKQGQ